jgi:predicted lipoprotein with Yx(FWY)xxD motif
MKKLICTTTLTSLIALAGSQAPFAMENTPEGVLATPDNITLRVIRIGYGINPPGSNSNQPRDRIVFADHEENVLYSSDKDMPGKSLCVGECTETWIPAQASDSDQPIGHWSIIAREDGIKQWAFRDRPLYKYAPESEAEKTTVTREERAANPEAERVVSEAVAALAKADAAGETKADELSSKVENPEKAKQAAANLGRQGGEGQGHELDGHQVVELLPEQWVTVPMGIEIEEIRTAPGQVLTDLSGMPLYAYSGTGEEVGFLEKWTPFEASQLALPIGDFTVVARPDGIYQWAYQGLPLYTYFDDRYVGDANGVYSGDERFQMVYALRYFMPENVVIERNHMYGGLLTTTEGETLYARETSNGGSDGALRGDRGRPATGKRIGISSCDATCEQTWKPLIAAADAKPSGYWTLYDREDGSKQWAYYGYALYAYDGEIDQFGSTEIYDTVAHYETPKDGSANTAFPMHWRVAPP